MVDAVELVVDAVEDVELLELELEVVVDEVVELVVVVEVVVPAVSKYNLSR